jgi:hypothetical protein
MAESQVLGLKKEAELGEKRSKFQSLTSAYHEFLNRIYWGYQAGEESAGQDDELDLGGIEALGEGGG